MPETAISVEKSCYIGVALEMIQHTHVPFGLKGVNEADMFKLYRAADGAVRAYAEALWHAGLITFGDSTSDSAAHTCRQIVKAIAREADPRAAGWRDERTYAAYLAREAAKTKGGA